MTIQVRLNNNQRRTIEGVDTVEQKYVRGAKKMLPLIIAHHQDPQLKVVKQTIKGRILEIF